MYIVNRLPHIKRGHLLELYLFISKVDHHNIGQNAPRIREENFIQLSQNNFSNHAFKKW